MLRHGKPDGRGLRIRLRPDVGRLHPARPQPPRRRRRRRVWRPSGAPPRPRRRRGDHRADQKLGEQDDVGPRRVSLHRGRRKSGTAPGQRLLLRRSVHRHGGNVRLLLEGGGAGGTRRPERSQHDPPDCPRIRHQQRGGLRHVQHHPLPTPGSAQGGGPPAAGLLSPRLDLSRRRGPHGRCRRRQFRPKVALAHDQHSAHQPGPRGAERHPHRSRLQTERKNPGKDRTQKTAEDAGRKELGGHRRHEGQPTRLRGHPHRSGSAGREAGPERYRSRVR
mmetsp:Transcript_23501/g.53621  ORF Transcript_23501/g.53621 Transcript_23501/m.53621 type:complete len:277 (+) Transcript_23501:555-1385(+)